MKGWKIIGAGFLLISLLSILICIKPSTIYPYLFLSVIAALLLTSVILFDRDGQDKTSLFLILLFVFLFLPSIWFISTRYAALTTADVTYEYAIINTFMEYDKIFVIPSTELEPSRWLAGYSKYPVLHTLGAILCSVTGIDSYVLPMFLPMVLSLIGFMFLYLIATKLSKGLRLKPVIIPLSLLIYGVSALGIFFHFRLVRQSLAVVVLLVGFYLIYNYISAGGRRIAGLIILCALLLVLTHHLSSFIFLIYLLAFFLASVLFIALHKLAKPEWQTFAAKLPKRCLFIGIVGIVAVGAFLGWDQCAPRILQPPQEVLVSQQMPSTTETIMGTASGALRTPQLEAYVPPGQYPKQLTPSWVHIQTARSLLIYFPVFFGFIWLIREKLKKKFKGRQEFTAFCFFVFSLVIFGVSFATDLFLTKMAPYRIVLVALPFVAFGSAIFYTKLVTKSKQAVFIGLVFVIVSSSLGLWAHRVIPAHVYSSAICPVEVGEVMPLDARHHALGSFASDHILDGASGQRIISDDSHSLYPIIPPPAYGKIAGPTHPALIAARLDEVINGNSGEIVVVDFGQNPYIYWCWSREPFDPKAAPEVRAKYRSRLENNLNKIYDNGFEIWTK